MDNTRNLSPMENRMNCDFYFFNVNQPRLFLEKKKKKVMVCYNSVTIFLETYHNHFSEIVFTKNDRGMKTYHDCFFFLKLVVVGFYSTTIFRKKKKNTIVDRGIVIFHDDFFFEKTVVE